MREKNGSSAVFLCIIMGSLAAICLSLIFSAREFSAFSRADALAVLTADSVLSEFDLDIQREYGLFLLHSSDRELTMRMQRYLQPPLADMTDIHISEAAVKGTHFVSVDGDEIREQILKWIRTDGAENLLKTPKSESGHGIEGQEEDGRILRHGPTITSLPSRRLPAQEPGDRIKAAGRQLLQTEQPVRKGTQRYLLESYLLGTFNSCAAQEHDNHFFRYEAEYVLQGKLSDTENRQAVTRDLKTLRFIPNLTFLYSDPVKREELAAVCEILSPGAGGAVLQFAAASVWAWAESSNDAKLLMNGIRVPAVKTPETWAVSVENIPGADSSGMILPARSYGLGYTDYLRVLLFMEDETLLLSRILDLIQINMRKNHDSSFLIGACYTGISVSMTVNGRKLYYEKKY